MNPRFSAAALGAVVVLCWGAPAAASQDSRFWLLGSLGLGGGSSRMGAFAAGAAVEADGWITSSVGLGARLGVTATGAPDDGGADGEHAEALVSYRSPLTKKENAFVFASLGAGWIHMKGYDRHCCDSSTAYDNHRLLLTPRVGYVGTLGPVGGGLALDGLVAPGQGVAITMTFMGGFTL